MKKHVRVTGAEEVIRFLESLDKETQLKLKKEVFKSGQKIETNAKRKAPVDTGRLRAAIEHDVTDKGFTFEVFVTVDYAPFVEFGTRPHFPPSNSLAGWARRHGLNGREYVIARKIARSGTRKQPFLFPAFEEERPEFIRNTRQVLKKSGE